MKLKERYAKEMIPKLQKELGIKNVNSVPKISKITINVGVGSYVTAGNKDLSQIVENVKLISGQQPVITKATKSISNFKLREEMPVGIMATLRGERMYDFLNTLLNITLPRVRDFRGLSTKAFDGKGNYSLGITEHIVFPEINPDDIVKIHGLQVCVSTTAKNDEEGHVLLREFGFPFKEDKKKDKDEKEKKATPVKSEETAQEEAPAEPVEEVTETPKAPSSDSPVSEEAKGQDESTENKDS